MRKAFTLVELLVVVAVIALLVALVIPGLRGAREDARRVRCLSNLHQIATGILSYAAQYHRIPPAASPDILDIDTQVYWCPSDPREDPGAWSYGQGPDSPNTLALLPEALWDVRGAIPILKERRQFHPAGINMAYSDGHVQSVR